MQFYHVDAHAALFTRWMEGAASQRSGIFVHVTDQDGKPVTGLRQENFTVWSSEKGHFSLTPPRPSTDDVYFEVDATPIGIDLPGVYQLEPDWHVTEGQQVGAFVFAVRVKKFGPSRKGAKTKTVTGQGVSLLTLINLLDVKKQ
jgi:hypothetical protein